MIVAGELMLEVASFSYPGGRQYNEDAVGDVVAVEALRYFSLADGAGGLGGGGVASAVAIGAARSAFTATPGFGRETLLTCIAAAQQAVKARQATDPRLSRMASTFVSLLVDCTRRLALMASLGDSRCYVCRNRQIVARSIDHSLVQRFVDAGLYPEEKLRQHPKRNVLYASLGANDEGVPAFVSADSLPLQPGDGALLCSDGVWEILEDDEIATRVCGDGDARFVAAELASTITARMGPEHDNFSGVVIRVR